jgi:hypothetical protein
MQVQLQVRLQLQLQVRLQLQLQLQLQRQRQPRATATPFTPGLPTPRYQWPTAHIERRAPGTPTAACARSARPAPEGPALRAVLAARGFTTHDHPAAPNPKPCSARTASGRRLPAAPNPNPKPSTARTASGSRRPAAPNPKPATARTASGSRRPAQRRAAWICSWQCAPAGAAPAARSPPPPASCRALHRTPCEPCTCGTGFRAQGSGRSGRGGAPRAKGAEVPRAARRGSGSRAQGALRAAAALGLRD